MDNIDRDEFLRLLEKYYYGAATKEERQLIEEQLRMDPFARQMWEDAKETFAREEKMQQATSENPKFRGRVTVIIHANSFLVSVGSIFLLLFAGYALYVHQRSQPASPGPSLTTTSAPAIKKKDVVLQFADGNILRFEGKSDDLDTTQIPARIDSIGQGHLNNSYSTSNNTLTVPRGVTYAIELPGGSAAYINSATQLKFPFVFSGLKREIYLKEGEVYFRVTADPGNPFVVHTSKGDVIAYGTTFSVSLYDGNLSVSVVTGVVVIIHQQKTYQLSSGQQALSKSGQNQLSIIKLDNRTLLGWLKGRYEFKEAPLIEVSKMIERVYDIDVIIDNPHLKQKHLYGAVFRSNPIEPLVKNICETGNFRYYFDKERRLHFR